MQRIKIKEIIVVEGKYDKIKLSSLFDAVIITTDGFGIYKNKEKSMLIKRLAQKNGVIVLTDADSAGIQIRSRIKQLLGDISVKNAYIPEISGKEKRKKKPSSSGLLGVEGIDIKILKDAVLRAATVAAPNELSKKDLYFYGLCGHENSSQIRTALLKELKLPTKMTANALLDAINTLYTKNEFEEIMNHIK